MKELNRKLGNRKLEIKNWKWITVARYLLFFFCCLLPVNNFADVRVKDITSLKGVRENQLLGYGLMVGLQGTGDGNSSQFTIQSLATTLNNLGIAIDPATINVKNVAGVIVTAFLPPFARMGAKLDVLVSSMGDAKSLQGGTLLLTPLKGADGEVYAISQGPIAVGGFSEERSGASRTKNHPTVGKIPGGATIEKELSFDFSQLSHLTYSLYGSDFTTATRVVRAINRKLSGPFAQAKDSTTIDIQIPERYRDHMVEFVSDIENIRIQPDYIAKVVVNERTGTVVIGEDVRISTIAIAHGNLSITIQPNVDVSQPDPFSQGETKVIENPTILVHEGQDRLLLVPEGVSIGSLVKALNAIGISPRDLIAVFQAIKAAGALHAELEII